MEVVSSQFLDHKMIIMSRQYACSFLIILPFLIGLLNNGFKLPYGLLDHSE